jgi:hypothetical protein
MPTLVESGGDSPNPRYTVTISRIARQWAGRLTGPYLPAEGVTAQSPTLDGAENAAVLLIPSEEIRHAQGGESASYGCHTEYDLGATFNAARRGFVAAGRTRAAAVLDYWQHGHQAAAELVADGLTLPEIAAVLAVSEWEASQLLAYQPAPAESFHVHFGGLRHWITGHARPAVEYAAPFAVRQARILAAEAIRRARQRGNNPKG